MKKAVQVLEKGAQGVSLANPGRNRNYDRPKGDGSREFKCVFIVFLLQSFSVVLCVPTTLTKQCRR
jgi:hypothetical protein